MITPNQYSRQADLVPMDILSTPITVVGAGGIGSFTVLALAKCGFNQITVFDDDTVEEHNLPNQFYPTIEVSSSKVRALRKMVKEFTNTDIHDINQMYDEECTPKEGIVISAVDSMSARKLIFDKHKRNVGTIAMIDGRMGGNQLEVYTTRMNNEDDKKRYKAVLWTDRETSEVRCTERAVIYNVLAIASFIVNQTRQILMNKPYNRTIILDLESMDMIKG